MDGGIIFCVIVLIGAALWYVGSCHKSEDAALKRANQAESDLLQTTKRLKDRVQTLLASEMALRDMSKKIVEFSEITLKMRVTKTSKHSKKRLAALQAYAKEVAELLAKTTTEE